ncbi:hypothetical protein ACIOHE_31045 [Streptomyces sp. NPDC087851]|uniref:hypothetical protein n=1 Tax=Streptomyces sp. NPDC087851 TaxID=3365810 RepID=UPI0037FCC5B2
MSRRTPLPPPPPPAHLRSWPDRAALLADRAGVLAYLGGRSLGPAALVAFWALVLGVQFGWGLVGGVLVSFANGSDDPISVMIAMPVLAVGLGALITAGVFLGLSVRKERTMRGLMSQWAALDSDPEGDARLRMAGRSLSWLLTSFAVGATGLWIAFVVPATAERGEDTYMEVAYAMGAGTVLWIAGLIGVARAVGHYRWAVRLVVPAAAR